MTEEAQRIAIAEACGWTDVRYNVQLGEHEPHGVRSDYPSYANPARFPIPDYLSDLNAMHEAEKVLMAEQHELFIVRLYCINSNEEFEQVNHRRNLQLSPWMIWFIAHTTAAQRAEAFLRTLNLWKDNENEPKVQA